ncbi:MAG: hypothetical protein ACOC32_02515 [Nanoarchaeota archaeon]
MKPYPEFLKTVLHSLWPDKYKTLRLHSIGRGFKHFTIITACAVLLAGAFYLPDIFSVLSTVRTSSTKFSKFQLTPSIETAEPIIFGPKSDPVLIIDSTDNYSSNGSKHFVDDEFYYYDHGAKRKTLMEAGNLLDNRESIFRTLSLVAVILIPSFIVGFFGVTMLLFLSVILLISLLVKALFLNIPSRKVSFKELFVGGLYAAIFLALALIVNAISPGIGIYVSAVFLVYFIMSAFMGAEKMKEKKHGDRS